MSFLQILFEKEALNDINCSSYSILFWNNLIIFFLIDIWEVSNHVNDVILGVFIVRFEHISHLFLVFAVDFEKLDAC